MCGRYTGFHDAINLQLAFGLESVSELEPRYNVAPSQMVPAVAGTGDGTRRKWGRLAWGLLPSWANDPKTMRPINARAETVHSSGMFRGPFKSQRCLLPASGFYEWKKVGKTKQPHFIRLRSSLPFAFAGLWESWTDGTAKALSGCSITTTPNELMPGIHDRMPVILAAENYSEWLASDTPVERLRELLVPYPADAMEAYPVSSYVSKATNEGPQSIAPVKD